MPDRPSLMLALLSASVVESSEARSSALASLRRAFFLVGAASGDAGPGTKTPYAPINYPGAWRCMKRGQQTAAACELQLISALENAQYAQALCALADLSGLPVPAVEQVLLDDDDEALLILGRSENFAWSTMRLLFEAWAHLTGASRHEAATLKRSAVKYDSFPRLVAERALRFIRAFAVAARTA